ncbi:GNAT family N-acetyltransferase [Methylibium sp. Pch-M]|uniref:GNAT family N-acetyltransferase n=1 Tax=Methylibium sp. Pch-M TaxID=2082386 RepID=UPI001012AD31|nr:GNAT family N-acetyltransferase [Methylibium sp. Pch-M]QAZ39535.1 GNAT family N-acetyltransferase [Methylibium sp. Pch-M]
MDHPLPEISWHCARLHELSPLELQRIHIARQQVFAVEQNCVFQDADEVDEHSAHLAAWRADGVLLAYARLVDPGVKYAEPSLGRVLTTAAARGTGVGRALVRRAVDHLTAAFPEQGLRISAQLRLERFYAEAGFVSIGEPYLEDDMPHIEMLRRG